MLVSASAVSAGSKQWKTGNGDFAGYLNVEYDYTVNDKTADSKAKLAPTLGALLFKKTIPVLGGQFQLGNYGSYSIKPVSLDVNKMREWEVYLSAQLFGVTLWSKGKKIYKTADFADVETGYAPPVSKKSFPPINFQAGPVPIQITYGINYDVKAKPKFSFSPGTITTNGVNSVTASASYLPQASASVFVEGAANLVVLKAGVGAALTLFSGSGGPQLDASLQATLANGSLSNMALSAKLLGVLNIEVLKGRVYAFVDRISIKCCFKKKWKRILDVTIVKWDGIKWAASTTLLTITGGGGSSTAGSLQTGGTGSGMGSTSVDYDVTADASTSQTDACGLETKLGGYGYTSGSSGCNTWGGYSGGYGGAYY